jgi:hypothetical protein
LKINEAASLRLFYGVLLKLIRRRRSTIIHFSFENIHLKIRPPAEFLQTSGLAFKTDGHLVAFYDDRDFASAVGILEHDVKTIGFFDDVVIIERTAFSGKCFTSCPGIRSSIFAVNYDGA